MMKKFLKLYIALFVLLPCASFACDEHKDDLEGGAPFSAFKFFSAPAITPISDLLAEATDVIGHSCTSKQLENLRDIGNAIVMEFVKLINDKFEPTDLAVARLVHFWLLNKDIKANSWLDYVKGMRGEKLSKEEALVYLVGYDGIASRTLEMLANGKTVKIAGIDFLVEVFKNAAKNFSKLEDNHLEFVAAQRSISAEYGCFSGSPIPYAEKFDVLNAALISAMNGELLPSVESRLEKLEKEVSSLKDQMENSIFQWPVTICVYMVVEPVRVAWPWVPFHGKIENNCIAKSLWCSAVCTATAIPLLGKALTANNIKHSFMIEESRA